MGVAAAHDGRDRNARGLSVAAVRALCAVIVAFSALAAAAGLLAGVASAAEGCVNEARRVEQRSTYLPDCRAYELVTPANMDSAEPEAEAGGKTGARAAADGDRMAWMSEEVLAGSESPGLGYLSTRGEKGWSSENVVPPQSVENGVVCPYYVGMVAWSADLEKGVLEDGYGQERVGYSGHFSQEGWECGHDEPRLVAGEREGFQNLFVRDNAGFARDREGGVDPYQLVNVTPSVVAAPVPNGEEYVPAFFLAGSADLSHVVFEEELPLTENAPGYPDGWRGHDDLYEWAEGAVHLVTILPDGTPVQGTLASSTPSLSPGPYGLTGERNIANFLHAVSSDGSRVFFQAGGDLYVRENAEREQSALGAGGECVEPARACTVQLDASQASGPGGGGVFMEANAEATKVFFTDEASAGLTADTAPGSGENLYEYDLGSGELTDLTPGGEAGVLGVSGAGEDGSRVYFVADGVLSGAGAQGASPTAGEPNLYVYEPDPASPGAYRTVFIATLAGGDECDWSDTYCAGEGVETVDGGKSGITARVSANGAFIGFSSAARLTSYENDSAEEIYLYDAATETLSCASCNPSGAAPTAGATIAYPAELDNFSRVKTTYPQRYVSDNGQVFFETSEALLGAADSQQNVYEYEGGELYLISSGTSDEPSYFLDASVSGEDVFFKTAQGLLPSDHDAAAYAIYDARVGGGFPEPPAAAAPCTSGEGCRGAGPGAPALSVPESATFVGAGNLTPAPSKLEVLGVTVVKPKPLTRAQKLAKALKACRARAKKKRASCEAHARKEYGAASKAKRKSAKSSSGKGRR